MPKQDALQKAKLLKHPALPKLDDSSSLALLCKAAGDSLRLSILRLLRTESLGVLEMSRILDIKQSALSHHLKVLANAGLVSTRRESNTIFYRRIIINPDDPLADIKSTLFNTVDRILLEKTLSQRLHQVKKEREQLSLDFFSRCADRFKQKQDMVAQSAQYASALQDLIDGLDLPGDASVIEVGPGIGELLPLLATSFKRIVALDNSGEMLDEARKNTLAKGIKHVQYVHGDTTVGVSQELNADLIVISMVLHHVASPADIFADCHRMLREDGVVLIVELCRHHQHWVRENCGDLWLGFEPEELVNWAEQAGFNSGQSLYLGLRNGFQIQMRLFHKAH